MDEGTKKLWQGGVEGCALGSAKIFQKCVGLPADCPTQTAEVLIGPQGQSVPGRVRTVERLQAERYEWQRPRVGAGICENFLDQTLFEVQSSAFGGLAND